MRLTALFFLFIIAYSTLSQHKNITVFTPELNPNEPSITIDFKNPRHIVAGCNLNWYAFSRNGGQTWQHSQLHSSYIVWGDPMLLTDTNSNFYYFHLSQRPGPKWLDRIVCQKSTDGGKTWNDGSFTEVDGKQHDKEWAVVDRNTNTIYMTWTVFDKYGSRKPEDSTHILFSKSTDEGESWTKPLRINDRGGDCIDSDSTVEGAVPTVGPEGEIYVVWAGHNKLYFDKSTDGGDTWLEHDKIIANQYGGWDYDIPGIYRANGLPVITCDLSEGPNRGTIYINYSDQKYGINDTDVWLLKSTDGGDTWSESKPVNDGPRDKQQFLTWMTIDQTNGFLYFVFYDRRNHPDLMTDVYMAVSKDGGDTFENSKISEYPFSPNKNVFFGDYTNISAVNGTIRPIWTRMDSSKRTILTAIINTDSIGVSVEEQSPIYTDFDPVLYQNYPNPFSGLTYVSFRLRNASVVNLTMYNSKGKIVAKIIDNKHYSAGKFIETIDGTKLNLQSGVYFYVLSTFDKIITKKMLIIK
jgi:hypothetical protein